ncbi:MAG TPA: hypothetical protein VFE17_06040 [Candidatus Baltobacteraceae bacterium]|jgi:hypothetical protein|nr:hypothetical protein [Candidatus Baltobacteraceae bacterium]
MSTLEIRVTVPAAQRTGLRRRQYISPSTQSMTVSVDGGSAQAYALTRGSAGCTSGGAGTSYSCKLSVSIDTGTHQATFDTYDGANGTGSLLSTNSVPVTINPGQANALSLTLNGVVAGISLSLQNPDPPAGTALTIPLTINAYDSDNNLIIGSGSYAAGPIQLSDSDTSGVTSLSSTSVASAGAQVTVTYNGAAIAGGSATFSASLGTIQTSGSQNAVLTPGQHGGAPASGRVSNYVPIHAYMGFASGGCEGGTPSAAVVQSVLAYVEACGNFDTTTVCPQTQAPPAGATGCVGEYYISPLYITCGVTIQTRWYSQENLNDETAFLHTASPYAAANRLASTNSGAKCPAPGQTAASDYLYWSNPSDSTSTAYWLTNFFQAAPMNGRTYLYAFVDNMEPGRPYGGGDPLEFPSLQSWRNALGVFSSSLASGGVPYQLEENALGPGGANFAPNNGTGNLEQVVNDAIDVTDLCDGNAGTSNIRAYLSERPWEGPLGTRLISGGNPKVLVNTASLFWADPNCKGNIDQLNAADTITLRMVTKAMEFILTKPGEQGAAGAPTIAEFRYPAGVTLKTSDAALEVPVFPEDTLVFVNPVTPLGKWQWSGVPDGGGCKNASTGVLSSDTGGTHDVTLARACGMAGTWDGGYTAPVYYREGTCYRQGVLLGFCAAVINLGTNAFTIKSSDFVNGSSYARYLAPTGGELPVDPVTGGAICGATNCNGAWGTQPLSGSPWSYSLPSCIAPSGDTGMYQNAYDCAVILLP